LVTMSSSCPSTLILADDDDWGAVSPLPTATSRGASLTATSTSFSASSGEFLNYVNVGVALAGGGGVKRSVWVLEKGVSVCLGKVGINNKFCVKLCEPDKPHCGTGRHASKFLVASNVAYIQATDNQVHCTPVLPLDNLTRAQCEKVCSMTFSVTEWESLFGAIQSGHFPDWFPIAEAVKQEKEDDESETTTLHLLSPMASRGKHGVFDIIPSFSFDSLDGREPDEGEELKSGEIDQVDLKTQRVESHLLSL
jgi:hypothetical protein